MTNNIFGFFPLVPGTKLFKNAWNLHSNKSLLGKKKKKSLLYVNEMTGP